MSTYSTPRKCLHCDFETRNREEYWQHRASHDFFMREEVTATRAESLTEYTKIADIDSLVPPDGPYNAGALFVIHDHHNQRCFRVYCDGARYDANGTLVANIFDTGTDIYFPNNRYQVDYING